MLNSDDAGDEASVTILARSGNKSIVFAGMPLETDMGKRCRTPATASHIAHSSARNLARFIVHGRVGTVCGLALFSRYCRRVSL